MIGVGNGVGGGHVIAVLTDGTRTLINGHVCHVCGYVRPMVRPWPCGHALRGYASMYARIRMSESGFKCTLCMCLLCP